MTQQLDHHRQHRQRSQQSDNDFAINTLVPSCEGKTDLFFSEKTQDMRIAQVICTTCVMRDPCLDSARKQPPFAGVWAGIIFVNGEEQLLKRGRGRPRKTEELDNARMLKTLASNCEDGNFSDDQDSGQAQGRKIA